VFSLAAVPARQHGSLGLYATDRASTICHLRAVGGRRLLREGMDGHRHSSVNQCVGSVATSWAIVGRCSRSAAIEASSAAVADYLAAAAEDERRLR